jgi:cell division transport system permease protein
MLLINIKRIIKSGFFNFVRNGFVSLSSILVMVITLSVIGSTIFTSAIFNSALDEIKNKVDVNVYFVTTAVESDILNIKKSLEALPEVDQVTYVSRDQVLSNFKKKHENDQFTLQALEELSENPLGATLNIKAKNPSQYESVANFLTGKNVLSSEGAPIIDKVNYFQNKAAIDKLTKIINSADRFGLFFTIILIAVSILITFNTIRLVIYISREEISVMRLVGASTFYIRGPFVVGGILYGIFSGLITLILFYPITFWLGRVTQNFFIGFNVFDYYTKNFGEFFVVVIGSGIAIGAISSYLAVKKYLKV